LIGNDVVDLADPEAAESALHPRFDARAFAPAERARLDASPERATLRWVLWAAKEAAWKAARRSRDPRPFHPAQLRTRLARSGFGGFEGEVTVGGAVFRVRVDVAGGAAHALARAPALAASRLLSALRPLSDPSSDGASEGVRALALDLAAARLALTRSELDVAHTGRLPELRRRGALVGALLSLSHHGRFAAAALALPPAPAERPA
jgi:phosphopantetheinyl transferase (holo-ACP synthase)